MTYCIAQLVFAATQFNGFCFLVDRYEILDFNGDVVLVISLARGWVISGAFISSRLNSFQFITYSRQKFNWKFLSDRDEMRWLCPIGMPHRGFETTVVVKEYPSNQYMAFKCLATRLEYFFLNSPLYLSQTCAVFRDHGGGAPIGILSHLFPT